MHFYEGAEKIEKVSDPAGCLAKLKPLLEGKTISKIETWLGDDDVGVVLHMVDGSIVKLDAFAVFGSAIFVVESPPTLLESVLSATEGSGR